MKPLLVGERDPLGRGPALALHPYPERSSGGRLRMILGLLPDEYLEAFDRVNLCTGGKWSRKAARAEASRLLRERSGGTLILLGARVCEAFEIAFDPFTGTTRYVPDVSATRLIILPHPSGKCRAWNGAEAAGRARDLLRRCGALRSMSNNS